MLLVHAELCQRAGFSILWQDTRKSDYLHELTQEIAAPGKGILDRYLLQFISTAQVSEAWINTAAALKGLDGASSLTNTEDEIGGSFSEPDVVAEYEQFERQRGYEIRD